MSLQVTRQRHGSNHAQDRRLHDGGDDGAALHQKAHVADELDGIADPLLAEDKKTLQPAIGSPLQRRPRSLARCRLSSLRPRASGRKATRKIPKRQIEIGK